MALALFSWVMIGIVVAFVAGIRRRRGVPERTEDDVARAVHADQREPG